MKLQNRMQELRNSTGLNRKEIASRLNMPYTTYYNYESGQRIPNSDVLEVLSEFYGVSIEYILGITDIKESAKNIDITANEYEHIQKYRALDERGRRNVNVVLNAEYEHTKKAPAKSEDSQPDIEFDDVMFLDEYGNRMIAPVTPEIKETAMRALKEHAEEESKRASETTDDASSQ